MYEKDHFAGACRGVAALAVHRDGVCYRTDLRPRAEAVYVRRRANRYL